MAFLKMPRPVPAEHAWVLIDDESEVPNLDGADSSQPRYIAFSLTQAFEMLFRVRKWKLQAASGSSVTALAQNGSDPASASSTSPAGGSEDPDTPTDTSDDEEDWMAVRLVRRYRNNSTASDSQSTFTPAEFTNLFAQSFLNLDFLVRFGYIESPETTFYHNVEEDKVYIPFRFQVTHGGEAEASLEEYITGDLHTYIHEYRAKTYVSSGQEAGDFTVDVTIFGVSVTLGFALDVDEFDYEDSSPLYPPLPGWSTTTAVSNLDNMTVELVPVEWYPHDDGDGPVWNTSTGGLERPEIYTIKNGTLSS